MRTCILILNSAFAAESPRCHHRRLVQLIVLYGSAHIYEIFLKFSLGYLFRTHTSKILDKHQRLIELSDEVVFISSAVNDVRMRS